MSAYTLFSINVTLVFGNWAVLGIWAFELSPVVCLSQERQTVASQCTILNNQSNRHLISYIIAIDFIIA